jgi:hypothetical protein
MAYTFTPNASGNIEVFNNGQRISTTTAQNAATQYGYNPTGGVAPAPTAFQQVQTGSMALGAVNTAPQTPYTPPVAPPAPVSVLSSQSGADAVQKATDQLKAVESTYTGPSIVDYLKSTGQASDQASRAKLAAEKGVTGYDFSAEKNTELLNKLRAPASNPALGAMVKDIESSIKGGGLTSTETKGYNDLIKTQDGIVSASAAARKALESGDYQGMDFYLSRAKELEASYSDQLTKYYDDTRALRERSAKLLSPTERERELGRELVDIRGQIDQFNLQTEEDKFREYEGQTQGFAGGRASEIDIRAEFKRSRMALEEKNLLSSLGLEQDARKMESDSLDKQLTYLAEDYDLQNKVQDKITKIEDDIFNRADTLREEAKSTLGGILDLLKGTNPASIAPSTLAQLETFASRAGLPFDLVQQALKVQYDRQVFEDSLARSQEARLSGDGSTGGSTSMAPKDITSLKDALNQSKFEGDEGDGRYADPTLYLANYNSWVESGGDPSYFLEQFPPKTYINPANTWLPQEILKFVEKDAGAVNPFE